VLQRSGDAGGPFAPGKLGSDQTGVRQITKRLKIQLGTTGRKNHRDGSHGTKMRRAVQVHKSKLLQGVAEKRGLGQASSVSIWARWSFPE
jgi:hypothetical protein